MLTQAAAAAAADPADLDRAMSGYFETIGNVGRVFVRWARAWTRPPRKKET